MSTLSTLSTLTLALALAGQTSSPDSIVPWLESRADRYGTIAHQIWEYAEVGYQEQKSSAVLQQHLREAGFRVEAGVAEIPTAFVATWGSGKPVLAFIGEFDALPGLSQQAVPERKPVVTGAPGHGCGHHLLGTGSMAAAVAIKEWLAANRRSATIRYYGTPAEEGGSGKVYMVRAGLFKDVDAVIAWHPGDNNGVDGGSHAREHHRQVSLSRRLGACRGRARAGTLGARRRRGDDLHGQPDARARPAGDARSTT